MYKEFLEERITKVIKDEISSSILYVKMAESIQFQASNDLADILKKHGLEEYGHFTEILAFAYNHAIKPSIEVDYGIICSDLFQDEEIDVHNILRFKQELEQNAIDDYENIICVARENADIETESFFTEILNDEIKHFDELAAMSGMTRTIKGPQTAEAPISDTDVDFKDSYNIITLRQLLGM